MNNCTSDMSTNSTDVLIWTISRLDLTVYSISFLFGLPAHLYVFWLIVKGTRSRVESEFFNLNFSVCEIGICLNSLFSVINFSTEFSELRDSSSFLLGLLVTGRPLFQCLMCVERYLAVVHPVTFLKFKPLRYRVICCSAAWIIIFGSCLCCMHTTQHCKFHLYIYFYSIQFLLFFSIQLFCLVAVLRALKQSGPGERAREREGNHMKRRAFHIILISTVTMSVIYMPFIFSGFSFILAQNFTAELFSFGLLCFILAGFVQPVLHLHRAGKLPCLCIAFKKHSV